MSNELPFRLQFSDHILLEWTGDATLDNFEVALCQVISNPGFRTGMPLISTLLDSIYNPSATEIQLLAVELGLRKDQLGPIALVVGSPVQFGIGNMLRAYSEMEGLRFEIFRHMEDAVAWTRLETGNPPPAQNQVGA